jgi:hypothetical protein
MGWKTPVGGNIEFSWVQCVHTGELFLKTFREGSKNSPGVGRYIKYLGGGDTFLVFNPFCLDEEPTLYHITVDGRIHEFNTEKSEWIESMFSPPTQAYYINLFIKLRAKNIDEVELEGDVPEFSLCDISPENIPPYLLKYR